MELFCFASKNLENIRRGIEAKTWAVARVSDSSMKAVRRKRAATFVPDRTVYSIAALHTHSQRRSSLRRKRIVRESSLIYGLSRGCYPSRSSHSALWIDKSMLISPRNSGHLRTEMEALLEQCIAPAHKLLPQSTFRKKIGHLFYIVSVNLRWRPPKCHSYASAKPGSREAFRSKVTVCVQPARWPSAPMSASANEPAPSLSVVKAQNTCCSFSTTRDCV